MSFKINKSLIIFSIFFLFSSSAFAQSPDANFGSGNMEDQKYDISGDPFSQAEYLFHSGELLEAKLFYHSYLSQNPSGERGHLALFRLGWIDQSINSYSTAIRFYQIMLQRFPRSLITNSVKFNMALCNYELENLTQAEKLFQEVLKFSQDKKLKWETMFYLAQVDEKRMNFEKALSKFKALYGQNENDEIRQQTLRVVKELINKKIGMNQISNLIGKLGNDFPVDLLLLKQISIFRNEGNITKYFKSVEKFLNRFPSHPRRIEVQNWLSNIRKDNKPKIIIGVILPLTGKLALTGQRVLQGIQLALNKLPFQSKEKLVLEVRDSGGQKTIKEAVMGLAEMPNIVGIIGPLLSEEVKVAGKIAREYEIPILSPTASTQGLVSNNPYLFRNALTRKIQAKFLAEYSINKLHLKRFAVLFPSENFGLELKDAFTNEVESLGGEVVAVSGYDRSQNDFKKQILELGGVEDDSLVKIARELVLKGEGVSDFSDPSILSRPLIDMGHFSEDSIEKMKVSLELSFDAIFIPGVYDKVGLIIPQLAFYNVNDTILLGANGWNSPELVKMGGKYIKTVYFVDGYYPNSSQLEVKKFVEDFKTNFGEEPVYLSAQAFDAANIFIESILKGADNRIKMKTSLKKVKNFPGVTGKTTLLPSGESDKNIFTLTVKRKKIVQEN
jgi:branched-chain amino acid transport system substrate-binding protein